MELLKSKKAMKDVSRIIDMTIVVFVFSALIGSIATQVTNAQHNLSGGASVLMSVVTIILVAVFILSIYKGKRN